MIDNTLPNRILYIQNDLTLCDLFKVAVGSHGYLVEVAHIGKIGLALHVKLPFDVVVIDFQLPEMTGIEIARILLADDPDLPILMVIGKGDQRLAVEAMSLGIANYLVKDDPNVFLELIPSILIHLLERTARQKRQIKTDQALICSESNYRSLVQASPVCIHEIDLEGNLISMNPAGLKMMGIKEEAEICGLKYLDVPIKADRERISVLMNQARQGEGSNFVFSANGETGVLYFASSFNPIMDEDGNVAKLMGVTQDITDRVLAEAALKESERRFRDLIEGSVQGVLIHDGSKSIFANQAYADIFGYKNAEEILAEVSPYSHVMPQEHERLKGYTQTRLNGGDAPTTYEFEGKRMDGSSVWLDNRVRLINWDGRPTVQRTVVDVTERKQLEVQLRQSQRLEAVGQLTGGVAHDFNNILGVMIGNAEMLLLKEIGNVNTRKHIEEIINAVDRASSLTTRLLAFSRQQVLSPVSSDVSECIKNLVEMLRRTIGETVNLEFKPDPDLWSALIDLHQFENAIVNLTLNARDAMPQGGTLTIKATNVIIDNTYPTQLEEIELGDYVKVVVSDNGHGMAPQIREKVFEPFFTTKEVGAGSGLGLSMVFGFAKQSDGHVSIDSEEGHGTTVNLYMPRCQRDVDRGKATDDEKSITPGSERILVVEDDENVREITVSLLSAQGYHVHSTFDGKQAIEELKRDTKFDLLFTDVILPGGMNGVDIAEQAVQLQANIKVLFTSGYTEESIIHNTRLDQEIVMINKPFRFAELLEKIRIILDENKVPSGR